MALDLWWPIKKAPFRFYPLQTRTVEAHRRRFDRHKRRNLLMGHKSLGQGQPAVHDARFDPLYLQVVWKNWNKGVK